MKTLIEFASDQMLTQLLVKERAKCLHLNKNEKDHSLNKKTELDKLPTRKMLSRMMPPRDRWVRPKKRNKLPNSALSHRKNAEKAMLMTIKHDEKQRKKGGTTFGYLDELHAFFGRIRKRLSDEQLQLTPPQLMPVFKDKEKLDDGTWKVTCRPLAVYTKLDDKIILALTNRYLARYLNRYLHENILSYRAARKFHGEEHRSTDFNDGARLIKAFREEHQSEDIFAADCDIKTFYDVFSHEMVRECFRRILDKTRLDEDGKGQVMRVLNAYLNSYNFYDNALKKSLDHPGTFGKIRHRFHDGDGKNTYLLKRVDNITDEEFRHRGVPQGGALSLITAGLDPRVTACVANHPALSDMAGYLDNRAGGYPHFNRSNGMLVTEKVKNMEYYDVVNFARRITCPTYLTWGYNDNVCPPTTSYVVWNLITAPKESLITPINEHWTSEKTNYGQMEWIKKHLK